MSVYFHSQFPQILKDVIRTTFSTAGYAPATAAKPATQNKDNIFFPFFIFSPFSAASTICYILSILLATN
jgi:hypothetical protein